MFYKKYTRTLNPIKQQFFYYLFRDARTLPQGAWLADVASYNGMNADIFNAQVYIAVDKDEQILKKIAGQKYKVLADILKLPFLPGSLDAVVSTHTLSHLSPEDRYLAIKELGRMVRPGGYFIFNTNLITAAGEKISPEKIRLILKNDFEIQRLAFYGGPLTKFYTDQVMGWFKKKEKPNKFLAKVYMALTLAVSFFELMTGLSALGSYEIYLFLRKKGPDGESGPAVKGLQEILACPADKSALESAADGILRCPKCRQEFIEQDGIIKLLDKSIL